MERIRAWLGKGRRSNGGGRAAPSPDDKPMSLRGLIAETLAEVEAMANYALSSGSEVPVSLLESLQAMVEEDASLGSSQEHSAGSYRESAAQLGELGRIHHALARVVHPASPRSILLLDRERRRPWWIRALGPVPVIRGLIIAGLIFVAAWIGLSLTSAADGSVDWQNEQGIRLLIEELHLLAAAGVGAAFAGLFLASRHVTRGTYDPKYASSYWIRLVLGVVAGMILALLVPLQGDALGNIGTPVLAMIGGFSVSVVYRILKRLVSAVETLVGGDLDGHSAADIERTRGREERLQERIRLGKELMDVRELLTARDGTDGLDRLDRTIADLIGPIAPHKDSGHGSPRERSR